MVQEATGGLANELNYDAFLAFMRSPDSIILKAEEDKAHVQSKKAPNSPTVLMKKPRASRPELIAQISTVVADKPNSKRRQSLKKVRAGSVCSSFHFHPRPSCQLHNNVVPVAVPMTANVFIYCICIYVCR